MTETLWVKHTLSAEEFMDLAQKMARAESAIGEKADQLKSVTTTIKAEIAGQEAILHSCAEKLRQGYEVRPKECTVKYDKGVASYADVETGEILETRPMTQDEQLRLTERRVDAEQVIRQARDEE